MLSFLKWNLVLCDLCTHLRRRYAKNTVCEMKFLNVAEKHDAAKSISGLLSNGTAKRREGYSVYNKIFDFEAEVKGRKSKMVMTSVSGHLLELQFLTAYRNWRTIDPKSLFEAPIRKVCLENYLPIKRTLEREIRGCQGLIIWTDCDREGENIGFEIIEVCRTVQPNITVYRAKFSEITSAAVRRALQQLGQPDMQQSNAVDVRTELDLRTGAAITRFQTMRLQRLFPEKIADKLISYGSCQIPTLGFVVQRYKEVEAFVSEPFWKIKVTHTIGDLTVEYTWARNRLFNKEECENYYLIVLSDPKATVESATVKPKSKWRPIAMDTVEMEKLSSRKLKLSAKATMIIAEKLYTKGIISYPRTETNQFSKDIDLRSLTEQQAAHPTWGSFAQRVIEWGPNPRNGSKSDQAHPPIHPTKLVTNLDGDEGRVYELICRHFLACISKDAVGSETVVNIGIAGEKFTATGLCIHERNYLDVYIYDKWNAKQIHAYHQGQGFEPTEISMPEGTTTAPPLLTEADLIALMDKHGIGTDATHADHINTIKERGYIGVVDNGFLVPGIIGMGLYEAYDAMQLLLAKPVLRAKFEEDLKKICLGEKNPKHVLQEHIQKYKEAYQQIMDRITAMDEKISLRLNEAPAGNGNAENTLSEDNIFQAQEIFPCPKCSIANLALKQKKNHVEYFIGCLNFPDCKNVIWLTEECSEPTVLSESCKTCGTNAKLLKVKFKRLYYKSLFNAPSGWYKTCIRCDKSFRETFNINLDTVKCVGTIISDSTSSNVSNERPVTSSGNVSDTLNSQSGATRGANRPKAPSKTKAKKNVATKSNNIRMYCTTSTITDSENRLNCPPQREANALVGQLDDFFDSNDGFDEVILALESNASIPVSSNTDTSTTTTNNNNNYNVTAPISTGWENGNDILGSAGWTDLLDSHDCDNMELDDFTWGTAEHRRRNLTGESSGERPWLSKSSNIANRASSSKAAPAVKCGGCQRLAKKCCVKADGPNKGKLFYVCAKTNACKFFQWANENSENETDNSFTTQTPSNSSERPNSVQINCNCNNPASSLIVRKEGPNKGRPFYACANRSCGFFKWGDENCNPPVPNADLDCNETQSSWGTERSSWRSVDSGHSRGRSQQPSVKRKCGLCRQEGHTRQKCPRKAEFDF